MAIADPTSNLDAMWAANFKAITDAGVSLIMGTAQDNRMSAKRLDQIGEAIVSTAGTNLVQPDVIEAAATKQILTGHAGADNATAAGLGAAILGMTNAVTAIMSKLGSSFPESRPAA